MPPKPPETDKFKTAISIRVDTEVLEFYRNSGRGWQSRINQLLRTNMDRLLKRKRK